LVIRQLRVTVFGKLLDTSLKNTYISWLYQYISRECDSVLKSSFALVQFLAICCLWKAFLFQNWPWEFSSTLTTQGA